MLGGWLYRAHVFQRRRVAKGLPASVYRDYLTTALPSRMTAMDKLPMLAVDLETTGLNPSHDDILSIGWVALDGLSIKAGSARHVLVCPERQLDAYSPTIHQITDDMAAAGMSLAAALDTFWPALSGRILVAHNAVIETGFLKHACQKLYGISAPVPALCTLKLAQRDMSKSGQAPESGALRLGALRQRYNLPRQAAHHALKDAMAGAELLLAQMASSGRSGAIFSDYL